MYYFNQYNLSTMCILNCLGDIFLNKYTPPIIQVNIIQLEQGLAIESTRLLPGNSSDEIKVDDWTPGSDINGDYQW